MAQYNIQYHAALVAVSDTAILFFLIQVRAQIEIELVTPPQPATSHNGSSSKVGELGARYHPPTFEGTRADN